MKKSIFDGYADQYDKWFLENENVFFSELNLLNYCLAPLKKDKILSVGCGSGLFESFLNRDYGINNIEGLEPSQDMAIIAEKRGLNVKLGDAETSKLPLDTYDVIFLNGCSTYIADLKKAYLNCYKALKVGGHLILLDVPKESAYGILYNFAKYVGKYNRDIFEKILPKTPYPIGLVTSGVFHTTLDKERIVKDFLNMKNIRYYQTLITNPIYTNNQIEKPIPGYNQGGYVALIAEK